MKHRKEKDIGMLEDMCVINALVILALALIYLLDILQRQWILWIVLALGLLLNLAVAACGLLRKNKIVSIIALVLFLGLCGAMIYLGIHR
ncbi:MAG: hypothetical protein PHR92_14695 [Lachnospiraceae bacterium]|nr:hypothetical protein [Lachnospiraceae bacterium]